MPIDKFYKHFSLSELKEKCRNDKRFHGFSKKKSKQQLIEFMNEIAPQCFFCKCDILHNNVVEETILIGGFWYSACEKCYNTRYKPERHNWKHLFHFTRLDL